MDFITSGGTPRLRYARSAHRRPVSNGSKKCFATGFSERNSLIVRESAFFSEGLASEIAFRHGRQGLIFSGFVVF